MYHMKAKTLGKSESRTDPWNWCLKRCRLPCGCQEQNPGLLEEQKALLTAEPGLQPMCFSSISTGIRTGNLAQLFVFRPSGGTDCLRVLNIRSNIRDIQCQLLYPASEDKQLSKASRLVARTVHTPYRPLTGCVGRCSGTTGMFNCVSVVQNCPWTTVTFPTPSPSTTQLTDRLLSPSANWWARGTQ